MKQKYKRDGEWTYVNYLTPISRSIRNIKYILVGGILVVGLVGCNGGKEGKEKPEPDETAVFKCADGSKSLPGKECPNISSASVQKSLNATLKKAVESGTPKEVLEAVKNGADVDAIVSDGMSAYDLYLQRVNKSSDGKSIIRRSPNGIRIYRAAATNPVDCSADTIITMPDCLYLDQDEIDAIYAMEGASHVHDEVRDRLTGDPPLTTLMRSAIGHVVSAVRNRVQDSNVNIQDPNGKTAAIHAITNINPDDSEQSIVDTMEALMSNESNTVDVRIADKTGKTVEDYALEIRSQSLRTKISDIVARSSAEVLAKVQEAQQRRRDEARAKLNTRDGNGETLMIRAIRGNDYQMIDELITAGVDLEIVCGGMTALQFAVTNNRYQSVDKLIKAGASLANRRASDGKNALSIALSQNLNDIVVDLIMPKLATLNDTDRLSILTSPDLQQNTPFYYAASSNNLAVVSLILDQVSDPKSLQKVLYMVADKGYHDMVDKLLNAGVDPDDADSANVKRTVLMLAAQNGWTATVNLLLKKGVNPKAKDTEQRTALHYAAHFRRNNIANILRDPVGDSNDRHGRNTCDFAQMTSINDGHADILEHDDDLADSFRNGNGDRGYKCHTGDTHHINEHNVQDKGNDWHDIYWGWKT